MAYHNLKIVFWSVLLICSLVGEGYSQESDFSFRQGETLEEFGKRIIPKGMKLAHTVVRGNFGSTENNIVILFHENEGDDYIGWVLIPSGMTYKKFVLPATGFPIGKKVEAIFFANADSDTDREILVLCTVNSGAGGAPFGEVFVYDWDGKQFKYLEDISDKLTIEQGEKRTVQEVRKRLKSLGY
jgi:hypothetical protein